MVKKILNKSIIVIIFILIMVGNGQVVIADDTVEEKNSGITSRIDDINSNT